MLFLCVGLGLEVLHGFKVPSYLGADATTRRLMWRLAHAHGALLALVHVAFGLVAPHLWGRGASERGASLASRALLVALVLLPGGFFAAGAVLVGGEPNPSVLLVPLGAAFLFVGVGLTAVAATRLRPDAAQDE